MGPRSRRGGGSIGAHWVIPRWQRNQRIAGVLSNKHSIRHCGRGEQSAAATRGLEEVDRSAACQYDHSRHLSVGSRGGVVDRRQLSEPQARLYTNFERWWASRGTCCLVSLFRFFVPVLLCPCRVLVLAISVSVGALGFGAGARCLYRQPPVACLSWAEDCRSQPQEKFLEVSSLGQNRHELHSIFDIGIAIRD